MDMKHKNLYLFLTLACFVGIILIFIFDGYMGLYDTLVMDNGQYKQRVEAEQWQTEEYGNLASMYVERGSWIDFAYTVENHRFSAYTADVVVSLWYGQRKVADLVTSRISPGSFGKGELKWTLETTDLVPADYPAEQSYNLSMFIKRGEVERKVSIFINPSPYPIKSIPVPPR